MLHRAASVFPFHPFESATLKYVLRFDLFGFVKRHR